MGQRILAAILALMLAGCGGITALVSQTRTVDAPREEVFARLFGDDTAFSDLPLVTNGGSTRLYELVVTKNDPEWASLAPSVRPQAEKVKFAVAMEIPREARIIYSVDDGALMTGLTFTFEEVSAGQTRVAFTIDELAGSDTKGLITDAAKLHAIAHGALAKLDDFNTVYNGG